MYKSLIAYVKIQYNLKTEKVCVLKIHTKRFFKIKITVNTIFFPTIAKR